MIPVTLSIVGVAIALLVLVISLDVTRGGAVPWIAQLRQWQALLGTMLGFATAAGILAVSASIQAETEEHRRQVALAHVRQALAVEAESLDVVLARAEQLRGALFTTEDADGQDGCSGIVRELAERLQRSTPIYIAAVPRFIEVGEPDLSLFVTFYGLWSEVSRDATAYVALGCPVVLPQTVDAMYDNVALARQTFTVIQSRYGTPTS